jgi:hypothetical protein
MQVFRNCVEDYVTFASETEPRAFISGKALNCSRNDYKNWNWDSLIVCYCGAVRGSLSRVSCR